MPSSRDPQVEILGFLAFKVKTMDPGSVAYRGDEERGYREAKK
jgi:hypothetical protein